MDKDNKTSFKKLVIGLLSGNIGYFLGYVVPTALLLSLKFLEINKETATVNFSLVTAVGGIATLICGLIAGVISDRTTLSFGKRRTWVLGGALIGALGLISIGYSKNLFIIVVSWVVSCIGFSFLNAAINALMADQCPEEKRGTVGGMFGVSSPVGIQLGIAAMTLINGASISIKFNILALIVMIAAIITCLVVKDTPAEKVLKSNKNIKSNRSIYPSFKKYPEYTWTLLNRFFMSMAYAYQTYLTLYFVNNFGISEVSVSGIVLINGVIGTIFGALASMIGGMLSDKFRKQKPIMIISGIIEIVGFILLIFAPSISIVYIGSALINIGASTITAISIGLVIRVLPSMEDAAKDISIINTSGNIPNSIVPAIAPTCLGIGGYPFLFSVLTVCGVIGTLSVFPVPEIGEKKKSELILEEIVNK